MAKTTSNIDKMFNEMPWLSDFVPRPCIRIGEVKCWDAEFLAKGLAGSSTDPIRFLDGEGNIVGGVNPCRWLWFRDLLVGERTPRQALDAMPFGVLRKVRFAAGVWNSHTGHGDILVLWRVPKRQNAADWYTNFLNSEASVQKIVEQMPR
jgi:hypothetical protein